MLVIGEHLQRSNRHVIKKQMLTVVPDDIGFTSKIDRDVLGD